MNKKISLLKPFKKKINVLKTRLTPYKMHEIPSFSTTNLKSSRLTPKAPQKILKWPAEKVRNTFLDFFRTSKHVHHPSSPVVPHNDPTLLFVNAGMVQFKPLFLNTTAPSSPLYKLQNSSAANLQKCIRAGGKHNDLDDVGKDTYHHTFFEMMGNWAFNSYWKKEAIDFAWILLTEKYGLNPECLYATYFEGTDDVAADLEARDLWARYLPAERIIGCGMKENFWEMGEEGPCGPCSEIHFDRLERPGSVARDLVNEDDEMVIEVWNLVFMQFNRVKGKLLPLEFKSVDTGMGFERLVSILQDRKSNYDTDIFSPIFNAISSRCAFEYLEEEEIALLEGGSEKKVQEERNVAFRVIADHLRTLCVAISDGAIPSSEGRGYVLRRIVRRAVNYRNKLDLAPGSLAEMVPEVAATLNSYEIRVDVVQSVVRQEENVFEKTLERGLREFEKVSRKIKSGEKFPGRSVFTLYESMGFPVDLTQILAEEKGLEIDLEEYKRLFEEHKQKSKGQKGKETKIKLTGTHIHELKMNSVKETYASFYSEEDVPAKVVGILVDGKLVEVVSVSEPKEVGLIFDSTSLYYESGGQVGDEGSVQFANGTKELKITDAQATSGFVLHALDAASFSDAQGVKVGDQVLVKVDYNRREGIKRNHTGTHLLNWALRKNANREFTVEEKFEIEVDQAGSLVTEDYLRFDFTSKERLSTDEVDNVQKFVQEQISSDYEVFARNVDLEMTKKIDSLRAVFGETYPDPVRVVSIGPTVETILDDPNAKELNKYSIELCGGTHVQKTSDIGTMAIMSEEAKSQGVRRMVAVTGPGAVKALETGVECLSRAKLLSTLAEVKEMENQVLKRQDIPLVMKEEVKRVLSSKKVEFMGQEKQKFDSLVKEIVDDWKKEKKDKLVVVLENELNGGKLSKALSKKAKGANIFVMLKGNENIALGFAGKAEVVDPVSEKVKESCGRDLRGGGKKGNFAGTASLENWAQLKSILESLV
eukprot:snap_masked-scaffold_3-processed-gene-20.20-mRNA-1 protein AED:0.04 eAED:0.04 QI:0/0/0/0.5/1/1/2/0/987